MITRFCNLPNKIIAVTGDIASGKTTLCKMFEANGHCVFYADKITKEIYKKESVLFSLDCMIQRYSLPSFLKRGEILEVDFPKLRKYVFEDFPHFLPVLEKLISDHFKGQFLIEYMKCRAYNLEEIYLEHPFIFKMGIQYQFDSVITCSAPEEIRLKRIMKRDGCSEEVAKLMIEKQKKLKIDEIDIETSIKKHYDSLKRR